MTETEIGKVTHYFTNIGVGIIKLNNALKVGETIHIKGATTDFTQTVESMQIEHEEQKKAKKGDVIGLKVDQQVRGNDVVYKVTAK